jgi:peptidoglycan/LPS O-acetylase OafA/YrhL
MKNKRLVFIIIFIAILLLFPLIAMQFTNTVQWTLFDFLVAGVLLFSTGLVCELVLRKVKKIKQRFIICLGVIALLTIIWIELAVGIF